MTRTGILLHVNEVSDPGWEAIAWGDPEADKLGPLPRLCQLLLTEARDAPVSKIVIYSGPTDKDGQSEGAYTKQFLLDNLGRLADFPTLRVIIEERVREFEALKGRIENIIVGKKLLRSADEIVAAAAEMRNPEINHVIQVACASHAPRCIQLQSIVRAKGLFSEGQIWSVVPSDTFFDGAKPEDTVIFEKPHLNYDPMFKFSPDAPEVLRQYFGLSPEAKRAFLLEAERFMQRYARSQA